MTRGSFDETERQGEKEKRRQGEEETRRQGEEETRRQNWLGRGLPTTPPGPTAGLPLQGTVRRPCPNDVSPSPLLPVSLSPLLLVSPSTGSPSGSVALDRLFLDEARQRRQDPRHGRQARLGQRYQSKPGRR